MTFGLLVGLVPLIASIALMRRKFGREWATRPYGLIVIMATVYQGASEVLLRFTGAWQFSRSRPPLEWADKGLLVSNLSLLIITVVYVFASRKRGTMPPPNREYLARVFDWRILTISLIPLVYATSQGRGYSTGKALDISADGGLTALAFQFYVPLLILAGFGFVLKYPRLWIVAAATQAVVVALAGQRMEVIVVVATLLVMSIHVGIRPSLRQLAIGAAAGMLLIVSLGSVRSETGGRDTFYSDTGITTRLTAIWNGLTNPEYVGVETGDPISDAALRLDAIAWSGNVAQAMSQLEPTDGLHIITTSTLSMVPSALYPQKSELYDWEKSTETYGIEALNMAEVDYLPGHITAYYGVLTLPQQMLWCIFAGILFALLDFLAMRSYSPVAIVLYSCLVQTALFFDKGIQYYPLSFRAALAIGFLIWLWSAIARIRLNSQSQASIYRPVLAESVSR